MVRTGQRWENSRLLTHSKTDQLPRRSILSTLDREVLDLGVRWVSYGGAGSEDIFITFGWNEIQYFDRLRTLVELHLRADEPLRSRLLAVCDQRLGGRTQGGASGTASAWH